jgi:hypothetical protein
MTTVSSRFAQAPVDEHVTAAGVSFAGRARTGLRCARVDVWFSRVGV